MGRRYVLIFRLKIGKKTRVRSDLGVLIEFRVLILGDSVWFKVPVFLPLTVDLQRLSSLAGVFSLRALVGFFHLRALRYDGETSVDYGIGLQSDLCYFGSWISTLVCIKCYPKIRGSEDEEKEVRRDLILLRMSNWRKARPVEPRRFYEKAPKIVNVKVSPRPIHQPR